MSSLITNHVFLVISVLSMSERRSRYNDRYEGSYQVRHQPYGRREGESRRRSPQNGIESCGREGTFKRNVSSERQIDSRGHTRSGRANTSPDHRTECRDTNLKHRIEWRGRDGTCRPSTSPEHRIDYQSHKGTIRPNNSYKHRITSESHKGTCRPNISPEHRIDTRGQDEQHNMIGQADCVDIRNKRATSPPQYIEASTSGVSYVRENLRALKCSDVVTHNPKKKKQSNQTQNIDQSQKSAQLKTKSCSICDFVGMANIARHIDQSHVPWFASPEFACWTCRVNCGSTPFTSRHSQHDILMMSDDRLEDWIERMNGFLSELVSVLGCTSLEEALAVVVANGWYPNRKCTHSERQFLQMRLWSESAGRPVPETVQLTPPNSVSALINRAILRCIVVELDQSQRDRLMQCHIKVERLVPKSPMRIVDSHAHLDQIMERSGRDTWLSSAENAVDLQYVICSLNFRSSWPMFERLLYDKRVYFTAGYHPHVTSLDLSIADLEDQERVLMHPRCLAFGEVGLDYFYHHTDKEKAMQKKFIRRLLPVAASRNVRVVIHCREGSKQGEAMADLTEIMTEALPPTHQVYLHNFVGTPADVVKWQSHFPDIYFGISASYSSTDLILSAALYKVPLDKLLIESDAPHVLSAPWELTRVFKEVGKLLNMSTTMVAELTRFNACRFYGLPQR